MPPLWSMRETLKSMCERSRLADLHPAGAVVVNRFEISDFLDEQDRETDSLSSVRRARSLQGVPMPVLVIPDLTYAPSLFFDGFNFVRRRLREVLDLP